MNLFLRSYYDINRLKLSAKFLLTRAGKMIIFKQTKAPLVMIPLLNAFNLLWIGLF